MLSMPPARFAALIRRSAASCGSRRLVQDRLDLRLGDHAGEPVAAQQEAVAGDDVDVALVDLDVWLGAERPGEDVAVRMGLGLVLGDLARLHHPVDERVVLGELPELAGAEQVGAGVADVREVRRGPRRRWRR